MTLVRRRRVRGKDNLSKSAILQTLGLPKRCLWPLAAARIRSLMVEARRREDDGEAAWLSMAKAILRPLLLKPCLDCGAVIKPTALRCARCNIPHQAERIRGERNHNAKVTVSIASKVKASYREGASIGECAARTGVSKATARKIILGEVWGHVK